MRRLILTLLAAVACLVLVLSAPAEAHARCDFRDHAHRRWSWNRTWTERWTYLQHDVTWEYPGHLVARSVWSVDGRLVRLTMCR